MDDKLYKLMYEMGDKQARERARQLVTQGRASSTKPGAVAVANAAGLVLENMDKWLHSGHNRGNAAVARRLVQEVGLERAVATTVRHAFDSLAQSGTQVGLPLTKLQSSLGTLLRQEMEFYQLSISNKVSYGYAKSRIESSNARDKERIIRSIKARTDEAIPSWERVDEKLIGSVMVHFLVKFSGVFEKYNAVRPTKGNAVYGAKQSRRWFVRVTDRVWDWLLEGINSIALSSPSLLPITSPPLDWLDDRHGGYAEGEIARFSLFISKSRRQREEFRKRPNSDLLLAVNTIQRTPWRINKRVFDVLELACEQDWPELGLVFQPPTLPDPPVVPYDKENPAPEWRTFWRKKRQHDVLKEQYRADKLNISRAISVGRVYRDFDRFYFPHRIDFRGRCYPVSAALQYQGPDWQRGCLEFATSKPVNTPEQLQAFLVHGANCWGNDKVSFAERIQWALGHAKAWADIAEDPIANRGWTDADSKFQFLAWCIEFAEYHKHGLGFQSCLPIAADGSNNGLQIYSLLLRDPVGGEATNCTPSEKPQDIYQRVADRTTEKLRAIQLAEDAKEARWAKRILQFCTEHVSSEGLPRAAVKRPVMTLPYGSTLYSCQGYLADWYHDFVRGLDLSKDQEPFPEKDAYNIFRWLGDIVWESIGEVVVKAREAMNWLREVSDVLSAHNLHASWTTPIGLKVEQDYLKGETRNVSLKASGTMVRIRVWEEDDRVKASSSRNGLCPNFIHSLDASAMFHTVLRASQEGITSFQLIHDSYATHAADAPEMGRVLREVFRDIFSEDVLGRLHSELQSLCPEGVVLPEPPLKGDLDIDLLTEALYFFA